MDFALTDEQQAVVDAARGLLEGRLTNERHKELDASTDRFDRQLWGELAEANLLGISLPEEVGGSGLGFLETCLLVEEVGRAAAPLPLLATVVLGALPIAEWGTDDQRQRHLPPVVRGERVLSAALVNQGEVTATRDGDGWRLDGWRTCIPAGTVADRILVPTATPDGPTVFIVDPTSPGAAITRLDTTTGVPDARLELDGASVGEEDRFGDEAAVGWMLERATAAYCSLAAGVCATAVAMTAEYTKTRQQFDRPIASFQAVGQRVADAYMDSEAVQLTARQAAWRLSNGIPATEEVAVAKFWAADGGQRVVHAAQHLHGGIGVDRDYPLHRYFLLAKQLELSLGGATRQLLTLGRILADTPV